MSVAMSPAIPESLRDDLLIGAVEIAAYLGPRWTKRKIYYAAEKGTLPISRVGETLVARKSELNRALSALPVDEMSEKITTTKWRASDYLKTTEEVKLYLGEIISEGSEVLFERAFVEITRSQWFADQVAKPPLE